MSHELKTEKLIARSPHDVFNAVKEGRLFMNCGSLASTMKIDFRVGGRYFIEVPSHQKSNNGEFLEIVPDKKIVFTWCQTFAPDAKPDTTVTIEFFAEGAEKTRVVIKHAGFHDKALCDAHMQGWTIGLNDMADEIVNGRLRMVRKFSAPVEKLFETCKTPESFFAFMGDLSHGKVDFKVGGRYDLPNDNGGVRGEFLEIVPGAKIKMSWLGGCGGPFANSQVTLLLHKKEDGSSLELIHDGLTGDEAQQAHREGWEFVTQKMMERLSARQ